MERITERDKLRAAIESKTAWDVERMMDAVVTCQSFSHGFAVITLDPWSDATGGSAVFRLYVLDNKSVSKGVFNSIKLPFVGTFDECNELMTEITK